MLLVDCWQLLVYQLSSFVTTCHDENVIGLGFKVCRINPQTLNQCHYVFVQIVSKELGA